MTEIDAVLKANQAYAGTATASADARPTRRLAVVTCMDARIDVFATLGLEVGQAHVIRNAGARVTDDVLRSLALSVKVMQVNSVILMQHSQCGLLGANASELQKATGANIDFRTISDHRESLSYDLQIISETAYLDDILEVAGCVLDVTSGAITRLY